MNNQLISAAYTTFVNKGALALLLGSGVSRKTGIPTGWDITISLVKQIAMLYKETITESPEDWYIKKFKEELDYSNLLGKLTTTQEERVNLLRPFIEPTETEFNEGLKRPTKAHEQIAQLVRLGYVKVIITTNFDRLIENALKDIGVEPTVISNPKQIENAIPLIHSEITVIKINGDYLDTGFLNLKSELEKYDQELEQLINYIFENFGLITCGWSAKWDIALVNSLKASNKFRFSNFYTHLNEPDDELVELSSFRRGHLVQITGADNFFTELLEDILALEKNEQHPLSPKIALARLKKYIVKEEHIISVHELLAEIYDDTLASIRSIEFPKPDLDSLKEAMNSYLKNLEFISTLLAEGVYWSKTYHDKIWIDLIKRSGDILEEENKARSYVVWSNIQYLPCLMIRYIVGIAAISTKNFKLLSLTLQIELPQRYESKNILEMTNQWTVIESDPLKKILGENYYTPMSELLHSRIRTLFKQVIPVDKEFDDHFDYYELICALTYVKNSNDNEHGYGPTGIYGHSNKRIVENKMTQAVTERDDFELIDSGIFKSFEEYEQATNTYNIYYQKITSRWGW